MSSRLKKIVIEVPKDARHESNRPFLNSEEFSKYANANGVACSARLLEAYERAKLMFPVARVALPRPLFVRWRRHERSPRRHEPFETSAKAHVRFIEFSNLREWMSSFPDAPETEEAMNFGHPVERALSGEFEGLDIRVKRERFQSWDSFVIPVPGWTADTQPKESRAEHLYAWWQVVQLRELNLLNRTVGYRVLERVNPRRRTKKVPFPEGFRWSSRRHAVSPPDAAFHGRLPVFRGDPLPGCWGGWADYFRRACSFEWRRWAINQCYFWNSGTHGDQQLWDEAGRREKVAARLLVQDTELASWVRFLRALSGLDAALAEAEQYNLQSEVRRLIRTTASLLIAGFETNLDELALRHDGDSRAGHYALVEVEGQTVRPWRLLEILHERKAVVERWVRPSVEESFKSFQRLLDIPLPQDTATTLVNRVSYEPDNPLLLAVADLNRSVEGAMESAWSRREYWSAIRRLAVAIESESKNWFGLTGTFDGVLGAVFRDDWKQRTKAAFEKKLWFLTSTHEYVNAIAGLRFLEKYGLKKGHHHSRFGLHLVGAYFTRNWAAHHGADPWPLGQEMEAFIERSLLGTLFVLWAHAVENHGDRLDAIYGPTERQ